MLLNRIDAKLGPQVNGGLSGYLQDRFTKLWNSRVVDRALNLMATAAAIHNGVMLSRNIGSTLIQTLANALSIIGIKDGDEVAQSFSTVIGDSIENIIKGLIGAENYTQLTETWAKANRIYQSAINIYQLMTDSLFGITSGLEQTAKYTGKIGNALRKSGAVLENSYNWMSEQFNFSSGKNRKIDQVIQGLQQANEIASDLESITSEFRSVTENITAIGTEINTIKSETNTKEQTKQNEETQGKTASQSPQINKTDLIKPDS
ncbi:Chromosome partition protein Smc [Microcystis aeruginosa]